MALPSVRMKRIKRDPERFDVFELYEKIARQHGLNLNDPSTPQNFVDKLSASFGKSKDNPKMLHGRHVQSMFEHVAAGLGKTILIKQEDAGEICSTDPKLQPPDFLIVLEDQSKIFVEVKNCSAVDNFSLGDAYLSKLLKYAALFGYDLYFAIFWSRWRSWRLIRPVDLAAKASKRSIDFDRATQKNHMFLLGDVCVGTKPPICMRMVADVTKPRTFDEDAMGVLTGIFTIGSVEISCNGILIEDEIEKSLAFYFMSNSKWDLKDETQIDGRDFVSAEFVCTPIIHEDDQDFQLLDFLSSMISHRYENATAKSGRIQQLSPGVEPGSLSIVIPDGHRPKKLPLLLLTVEPNYES